jgi:two-component system response regulator VicR
MKTGPLTTGAIADYCHVTYVAVLKWISSGKLKAYRTPGKHCRVNQEDFLAFLKEYHMPIPEELEAQSQQNGKKKVLIIDDDKNMVSAINRILRSANGKYEVACAFDGFDAGRKVYDFHPDIMLLDIRMPGIDGYEVIKRIKQETANRHIKIIAMSAYFKEDGKKKVVSLGAAACLDKPFESKELLAKIEELLNKNS